MWVRFALDASWDNLISSVHITAQETSITSFGMTGWCNRESFIVSASRLAVKLSQNFIKWEIWDEFRRTCWATSFGILREVKRMTLKCVKFHVEALWNYLALTQRGCHNISHDRATCCGSKNSEEYETVLDIRPKTEMLVTHILLVGFWKNWNARSRCAFREGPVYIGAFTVETSNTSLTLNSNLSMLNVRV